jgi:hypothetical protein
MVRRRSPAVLSYLYVCVARHAEEVRFAVAHLGEERVGVGRDDAAEECELRARLVNRRESNTIESLNMTLRKVTKNRSLFPNDEANFKLMYLALRNISKRWTMLIKNWSGAINQFAILFEGRVPMGGLNQISLTDNAQLLHRWIHLLSFAQDSVAVRL